jgi:hypothetical protein
MVPPLFCGPKKSDPILVDLDENGGLINGGKARVSFSDEMLLN